MKKIRWDNVGYLVLTLALVVLTIKQANWLALCAVLVAFGFMALASWYRYNLMRAKFVIEKAVEVMEIIREEHMHGDPKD
jgi:hypothetical protein